MAAKTKPENLPTESVVYEFMLVAMDDAEDIVVGTCEGKDYQQICERLGRAWPRYRIESLYKKGFETPESVKTTATNKMLATLPATTEPVKTEKVIDNNEILYKLENGENAFLLPLQPEEPVFLEPVKEA